MCRKVTRERNARTVLRFAPKTSHLSKQYTHTYSDSHDATDANRDEHWYTAFSNFTCLPLAIRYAGFVLSKFTVLPDGRTPFQYLLRTPYVSPLCMLGESVFGLIPDHKIRAAKLTNGWISSCWWRRDASSDEHLVGTKHGFCLSADQFAENLLENNGVDVKRSKLEGRNGILTCVT